MHRGFRRGINLRALRDPVREGEHRHALPGSVFDDLELAIGCPLQKLPPDDIPGALDAARLLYRHVYMDVMDCVIYASAVQQEADEILTHDSYLGRIVGWIHNPGSAQPDDIPYWTGAHAAFLRDLTELRGPRGDISLPAASAIPNDAPVPVDAEAEAESR